MPVETAASLQPPAEAKRPVSTAVRCKVCGYIMDASKVGDLCPACGVKATMFEPLTEKFSDSRRKFLDLHIHPILTHYPQAFSVILFIFSLARPIVHGALARVVSDTLLALAVALPITLAASFVSGIADGRVRFRKLKAPYLRIKLWVGITYIGLSLIFLMSLLLSAAPGTMLWTLLCIATAIGLLACTSILGNIGSRIASSRLPG